MLFYKEIFLILFISAFSPGNGANEGFNFPSFLSWLAQYSSKAPAQPAPPVTPANLYGGSGNNNHNKPLSAPISSMSSALNSPPVCGVSKYTDGVVPSAFAGAGRARPNEAPWLVRVIDTATYRWFCDGVIINQRVVLTPASCLENNRRYEIVLADHTFGQLDPSESSMSIGKIVVHPLYQPNNKRYDFALLFPTSDIQFDNKGAVRPICLPSAGEMNDYVGSTVIVHGWSTAGGSKSSVLQKDLGSTYVKPVTECQRLYLPRDQKVSIAYNETICAGSGSDLCNAELGSPLAEYKHGRHFLIGLASVVGQGCASKQPLPALFARVAPVVSWILAQSSSLEPTPPAYRPPPPPPPPPPAPIVTTPKYTIVNNNNNNNKPAVAPQVNPAIDTLTLPSMSTGFINDLSSPLCGVTKYMDDAAMNKPTFRIVGGFEAKTNQVPWQVRVLVRGNLCGGTIIHKRAVLTAAHCATVKATSAYRLVVGDHTVAGIDPGEQTFEVAKVIAHEGYNERTNRNDFALLITAKDIPFTSWAVRPACLPTRTSRETYAGWNGTISGWGRIASDNTRTSDTLKVATVNIMTQSKCTEAYKSPFWFVPDIDITDEMVCASAVKTDSCQGDSGGPLTAFENGRHTLIGVTSFGKSCASDHYPGVYAKVASALDWLERTMLKNQLIR